MCVCAYSFFSVTSVKFPKEMETRKHEEIIICKPHPIKEEVGSKIGDKPNPANTNVQTNTRFLKSSNKYNI